MVKNKKVAMKSHDSQTPCHVGTIMTISKDRVKPSPLPDSWKLQEIFATGIVLGTYLAIVNVIFFWVAYKTTFIQVSVNIRLH